MADNLLGFLVLFGIFYIFYKCFAYICKDCCSNRDVSTDSGGFMTSRALQPRDSVSIEREVTTQPVQTNLQMPMPMPYYSNFSHEASGSQIHLSLPYPPLNSNCPYPPQCPYPTQMMPPIQGFNQLSQNVTSNSSNQFDAPPNYEETMKIFANQNPK